MKLYPRCSILSILFLLFTITVQAQPNIRGVQDNLADRLAEGNILGASIAYIYPDGRTQFINRGSLSTDRERRIDEHTIFEIGSVSKTFTALLMMKMAEEGALALDTPVSKLLPDSVKVPRYESEEITLKHLATIPPVYHGCRQTFLHLIN